MKQEIKIIHIVSGNLNNGAGRGAYWLHTGLLTQNINSKILTNSKNKDFGNKIISTKNTFVDIVINRMRSIGDSILVNLYPNRKKIIFSTGLVGINLAEHPAVKWADIVHLHWINNGFIDIKQLSKVNKPIIWTIRDMWPFTGGCHIAEYFECENYQNLCQNCIQLGSNYQYDLSTFVFNRKSKFYPKKMIIVAISNWLKECAEKSALFYNNDCRVISNNVDLNFFYPENKQIALKKLNINTTKQIILTGAIGNTNEWKGFSKFLEALTFLDKSKYFILFFGKIDSGFSLEKEI